MQRGGIGIREAAGSDAEAIREIFLACYGRHYFSQYYDIHQLKKLIYSDDTLLLVAEDLASGAVVGTASVILEIGADSDLAGEFGRLAVHPDARRKGVAGMLLESRLERVRNRLHVALMEARCIHDYSQRGAEKCGFRAVGFLPLKLLFEERESATLMVRYLENALALRKNNPRVIPEAYPLAALAMKQVSLALDVVVDEKTPSHPSGQDFYVDELTEQTYPALLRIERGRVRNREIFGPMRLHYGFFRLNVSHCYYLVARDAHRQMAGAVGFMIDDVEKTVRVFELIIPNDRAARFLLHKMEEKCFGELGMEFVEIDVSAHSPRMQRTLIEMGYVPGAYVPAMVFHRVERLDIVKMIKLREPFGELQASLLPGNQEVADVVLAALRERNVQPRIDRAVSKIPLFAGLGDEQARRLAGVFEIRNFAPGEVVFTERERPTHVYIILEGQAAITVAGSEVGRVGAGECLGETALLSETAHSATARAASPVETARLSREALADLARARPDIGLAIYRNLAVGLGEKLRRADAALARKEG